MSNLHPFIKFILILFLIPIVIAVGYGVLSLVITGFELFITLIKEGRILLIITVFGPALALITALIMGKAGNTYMASYLTGPEKALLWVLFIFIFLPVFFISFNMGLQETRINWWTL